MRISPPPVVVGFPGQALSHRPSEVLLEHSKTAGLG